MQSEILTGQDSYETVSLNISSIYPLLTFYTHFFLKNPLASCVSREKNSVCI